MCGQDVAEALIQYIDRDVPVLIHSMNSVGRQAMASRLERAGFAVGVIPMNEMTATHFEAWLAGVRQVTEER